MEDVGKGFPLVFVHGYLGSSEMWNFQKEFFSKHYRVIIPALPGFGESHNIKSLDSINKMAREIINIFIICFMSILILFIVNEIL